MYDSSDVTTREYFSIVQSRRVLHCRKEFDAECESVAGVDLVVPVILTLRDWDQRLGKNSVWDLKRVTIRVQRKESYSKSISKVKAKIVPKRIRRIQSQKWFADTYIDIRKSGSARV